MKKKGLAQRINEQNNGTCKVKIKPPSFYFNLREKQSCKG